MKKCPRCGYAPSNKIRSDSQNKYYWGVIVHILSEELGYDPKEIHEILKTEFLTQYHTIKNKIDPKKTYSVAFTKSSTELDTKAWEEFMSSVRMWASRELGIYIPEPNENI